MMFLLVRKQSYILFDSARTTVKPLCNLDICTTLVSQLLDICESLLFTQALPEWCLHSFCRLRIRNPTGVLPYIQLHYPWFFLIPATTVLDNG